MKILVTGADGLVGSAIRENSTNYSEDNFIFCSRKDLNLLNQEETNNFISKIKPDSIIHTAARVGGIGKNISTPAQQFTENIYINTNIIHSAYLNGVKKLIAFSSVCAFPNSLDILSEDKMHDGIPHEAHRSYAYSKRMVDIQIESYNKQYGLNYCSVIPGNIFGERDNYDLENGHVIPSLIHKFFLAKKNNQPVVVWGNGEPYREFIYSKDISKLCLELIKKDKLPPRIIMSGELEIQIKEIVKMISDIYEYKDVIWDIDKPNGQMRRPSEHSVFRTHFSDFKFEHMFTALKNSIEWFQDNYPNVRM
jgi:GDP-L-fucose synthase